MLATVGQNFFTPHPQFALQQLVEVGRRDFQKAAESVEFHVRVSVHPCLKHEAPEGSVSFHKCSHFFSFWSSKSDISHRQKQARKGVKKGVK